jgi:hypothetical protein
MVTTSNAQSTYAAQKKIEKQLEYRALAPAALIRLQTKNGELNKITKKENISIMLSFFLVFDDDKMKKDLLTEAFMTCYEKSPAKIPFFVWRTATTSQATPAATSATAPVARVWDEDRRALCCSSR